MLSRRELEPYHLYDETAKEFQVDLHTHSFDELAQNTSNVYFEPKRSHKSDFAWLEPRSVNPDRFVSSIQ